MNKKIIYLLTCLILACFTISASTIDETIKLSIGHNDELYQISDGTSVMYMGKNGQLRMTTASTLDAAEYLSSLWYIDIEADSDGTNPKFNFRNRMYGRLLAIDMDDPALAGLAENTMSPEAIIAGGNTKDWTFSSTYENGVEINKPIFSYFKEDSVIYFQVNGTKVVALKEGASKIGTWGLGTCYTLQKPKNVQLNAKALNTMLGMNPEGKSFKLKFDKENIDSNVFANELTAVSDTIYDDYVTLINTATGKYLRVDTAYHDIQDSQSQDNQYIQLTDTTSFQSYSTAANGPALANGLVTDHYAFKFEYSPASDNIFISVHGAILKKEEGKSWSESQFSNKPPKSLQINVMDLVDSSILTVGEGSTKITLGISEFPSIVSNETTIPDDLYVIKSTDGQYLAVPLDGDTTVQWVTLDENVNVWAMPSFQWVVEKNIKDSDISPIQITNREFNGLRITNVQLNKVVAATLVASSVMKGVMTDSFTPATDAIKSDSYLGYKYLDTNEMEFVYYKFRYLKESPEKVYIGVNEVEDDPGLYVGAKSDFLLQQDGDQMEEYGYTSWKIPDLKPLYRKVYTMKINNPKQISGEDADNIILNDNNLFAVSKSDSPARFILKASSEESIDGVDVPFYTFIKLGANVGDTVKIGVDDNNKSLKSQAMTDSPASAFSVEGSEYLYYKRLENDTPDTVNFFPTTSAPDNSIVFPEGKTAIYVDTAYVNRGTENIKPQYLLAVDVKLIPEVKAVACTRNHNHGYDQAGNPLNEYSCPYATKYEGGYVRGRYLMSADYDSDTEQELSFVEAIHKGDILYILTPEETKFADPVDFSALTGTQIRLDNNDHKNAVFSFRLSGSDSENFLIESKQYDGNRIAPQEGGWLRFENGKSVISQKSFADIRSEAENYTVKTSTESPKANDVVISSEAPAVNGWYTKAITLTAPVDYTIALKNNPDYAASFTWETDGSSELTYSMKQDGTDDTEEKTIIVKLDLVDPTISASVSNLDYTLRFADQEKGSGISRLYIDGREVAVTAGATSYNNTGSAGEHTALLADYAGRIATVNFTLTAKVDPPVEPVYYTVTLPVVEGVTTDPVAGDYSVVSWDNFGFYLTLEEGYRQNSQPVVKVNGSIITPRNSDSKYIIKYIREDTEVEIDGILKDNPVANAQIDADIHIRSVGRMIYIDLPVSLYCHLTDLSGKTIRRLQLSPGENCIDGLAAGIYIINLGDMPGIKVLCKD